jgi:cation diffusion facilitator family transporter
MALLADGLHMASHAFALGITWFAYVFARKFAQDPRFSFGTGKVNSLGAFASALLLAVFAFGMAYESFHRFLNPVTIQFNQAIFVAVLGLLVNGISAVILGGHHGGEGHAHDHGHDHQHHHEHGHTHTHTHSDHNLRAAYFHVIADALTSVTAIFALLAGKYFGWNWMDPAMGVLGSLLVARWSWGLLRDSSRTLLDRQAPDELLSEVRSALETDGRVVVSDLHVWSIGPGIYAAAIEVCADEAIGTSELRTNLPANVGLLHVTLEVRVKG